jgi:hypothetical protein
MRQIQLVSPRLLVAALLVIGMSGCSGGESGNLPPADPDFSDSALGLNTGFRQLIFSWFAVDGATHYKLFQNPDGASGFTQVGADIPADEIPDPLPEPLLPQVFAVDISVHKIDWVNARYRLESCDAMDECTLVGEQSPIGLSAGAIGYVKTLQDFGVGVGFSVSLSDDATTLAAGAPGDSSAVFDENGNVVFSCYENGEPLEFDEFGNLLTEDGMPTIDEGDPEVDEDDTPILDDEGNPIVVTIEACETAISSGTVPVFNVGTTAEEFGLDAFLKAGNFEAGDQFGWSVALDADGDVLVASSVFEDGAPGGLFNNNDLVDSGAAYVFRREAGVWPAPGSIEAVRYLKASNADEADFFGQKVAISGDGSTIAVAAVAEGSNATGIDGDQTNNDLTNAGAVYVFRNLDGEWAQEAYIKASNTGAEDNFGLALELNETGDLLVVGAPGESSGDAADQSDNGDIGSGAVYVFSRSGTIWMQQAYLKASNPDGPRHSGDDLGDSFGTDLSLNADGSLLLIGAPLEDSSSTGLDGNESDNSSRNSGAAYLFTRTGDMWAQQTFFKASNTGGIDEFGTAVALSSDGNALVISAPRESSQSIGINGAENIDGVVGSGAMYYFENSMGGWQQEAFVKGSVRGFSLRFGFDVDLAVVNAGEPDEINVLVGSTPFEDGGANDSGALFVY